MVKDFFCFDHGLTGFTRIFFLKQKPRKPFSSGYDYRRSVTVVCIQL